MRTCYTDGVNRYTIHFPTLLTPPFAHKSLASTICTHHSFHHRLVRSPQKTKAPPPKKTSPFFIAPHAQLTATSPHLFNYASLEEQQGKSAGSDEKAAAVADKKEAALKEKFQDWTIESLMAAAKISDMSNGTKAEKLAEISIDVLLSAYANAPDLVSFKNDVCDFGLEKLDGHKLFILFKSPP
jgi:hypothetical protein